MFGLSFSQIIAHLERGASCRLTTINLSMGRLDANQLMTLFSKLEKNSTLEELSLAYCQIDGKAACSLFNAIQLHPKLRKLDISDNKIGNEGARGLSQLISKNTVLEDISVENNGIGVGHQEGFVAIAEALKRNQSVKTLCLRKNKIGNRDASAFSDMLKINRTLQKIDFSQTEISAVGIEMLADGLKSNVSILSIDIESNRISEESAKAFVDMLDTNKTLLCINGLFFSAYRRIIDRQLMANNDEGATHPISTILDESSKSVSTFINDSADGFVDNVKLYFFKHTKEPLSSNGSSQTRGNESSAFLLGMT